MTPGDLWLRHRTHVAELDDMAIYAALTIDLATETMLTVQRRAVGPRPQGVVIDTDLPCRIGDVETTTCVLWSDTAPTEVAVTAPPGRLTISHVWRSEGTVHGWIGWSGIRRVEDDEGRWHLVASDGHDDLADDLDVTITFDPDLA